MRSAFVILFAIFALGSPVATSADESPAIKGSVAPTASEAAFVHAMNDLAGRFATARAAEAAPISRCDPRSLEHLDQIDRVTQWPILPEPLEILAEEIRNPAVFLDR